MTAVLTTETSPKISMFPEYRFNDEVPLFQETACLIGVSKINKSDRPQKRLYWSLPHQQAACVTHCASYNFKPQWYQYGIESTIRSLQDFYMHKGKPIWTCYYAPTVMRFSGQDSDYTWETDGLSFLKALQIGGYVDQMKRFEEIEKQDGRYYLVYCQGDEWDGRVYITHESEDYMAYPVIGQIIDTDIQENF
ncbi:MAG: hypothetical protein AAGA83_00195 [Cyanobacteria bacterium P01_F01_bin.116]